MQFDWEIEEVSVFVFFLERCAWVWNIRFWYIHFTFASRNAK